MSMTPVLLSLLLALQPESAPQVRRQPPGTSLSTATGLRWGAIDAKSIATQISEALRIVGREVSPDEISAKPLKFLEEDSRFSRVAGSGDFGYFSASQVSGRLSTLALDPWEGMKPLASDNTSLERRFLEVVQAVQPYERARVVERRDEGDAVFFEAEVWVKGQEWPLLARLSVSMVKSHGLPEMLRLVDPPATYRKPLALAKNLTEMRGRAASSAGNLMGWSEVETFISSTPSFAIVVPDQASVDDLARARRREAILVYSGLVYPLNAWSERLGTYTTAVEVTIDAETGRVLKESFAGSVLGNEPSGAKPGYDVGSRTWTAGKNAADGKLVKVAIPSDLGPGYSVSLVSESIVLLGAWHPSQNCLVVGTGKAAQGYQPSDELRKGLRAE